MDHCTNAVQIQPVKYPANGVVDRTLHVVLFCCYALAIVPLLYIY